ncbi:hypothetical protein BGZ67_003610 [Mortierella alpina]|nr:hypothetical protein BGZ67_003610 [Mortierella alpina]
MQGSDSEARVHASVAHRPGPGASPAKDNVEAGSVSSSSSSSLSHPTSNNPSSSSSSKATPPTLRPPSATFLPPSSSASAAPSPSRLPGTPPANPPPRFFTRPYRRPLDHSHHHHGSTHGSGHGGGQSSSSIGVRSAFKDFVVPAQIILVCSILNALWPTMLRIVTTTLEFLVLVLSSYSACARRSDDCYFLEPLLNDGQEAIYVGTIQWALRSVFSILFLGALVFISKKLQTIWSALMNNRRRPRSFWSLDNIWSWIMTYPNLLWRLAQRIFPWRITRSSQSRSSQNTRHYRKTTSAISPTAGAHQYSGPSTAKDDCSAAIGISPKYTQKVPSLNAVDTDTVSAGSGSESRAKAKTKSRKAKPLQGKAAMSLSRSSSGSMLGSPDSTTSPGANLQLDPKPILVPKLDLNDRVLSTVGMVSQTITEGADDDDFISTDRRRRRKTKSLKINSAANSTESLLKAPCASSLRQDLNASQTNAAASNINDPTPSLTETKAGSGTQDSDPAANPTRESLTQEATIQEPSKSEDAIVAQKPSHLKTVNHLRDSKPGHSRPAVRSNGHGDTLQSHTEGLFVHPLHALNSSSPIVRLKPSHKRSQSAQLPSCSPWSIPLPAGNNTKFTRESSLSEMCLPASPTSPIEQSISTTLSTPTNTKNETGDRDSKSYDLFGQSSIWYSPFQSGLDISIESDQEQGKHGSRSVTRPKPRIQVDLVGTQNKPSLGSFLPPSSFFESSPRTPRIMPFSQHNRNPGSSTLETEDWSVRTRSSSIAAPMTPLLEADCMDPMDYFGGSRSANSSRRGSVENNLTESLLSGRARMFANIGSAGTMSHGISQDFATSSPVDTNNTLLSGGGFLSSRLNPTGVSSPLAAFASATPPMAGQSSLDTPTLTDSSLTTGSLDAAPVFVNPWESNYPYRSNHTVSETFLPFGSSSGPGGIDQGADQGAEQGVDQGVDLDRQSSLLRLMNGNYVNGSSGTGGNTGGMNVLFKAPPPENEIDSIRKGFHRPDHARHSGLPLQQLDVTSFRPFASVEMSLAAAANQPPPLQEDPQYDLLEWTLQHQLSKPSNKASAENADSAPGRVFGTIDKKPRERHRHGRSRSGHHKSASLGSFFPPVPPASGVSDSATPCIQANTGGVPPNRSLLHRSGSDGRSHMSSGQNQRHGHGSQDQAHGLSTKPAVRHQGATAGSAKEGGDGVLSSSSSSTVPRRRAGTDLDSQPHRGANKHHHHHHQHPQESTKTKRGTRKEQPIE